MNTNIIRSKKVSSTAPMMGRTSPAATPSCSQAVAVSRIACSNACSTPLKAQTTEKLADRFGPNAALEAEGIERRHHQADEPTAACLRFSPPGLRVLISALHRLCETMHTALGEPGLMGDLADALLGVVTKSVENPQTFGPQSHVGLSSEGKLNSWSNSAPQSTGPTPHCPALGNFPQTREKRPLTPSGMVEAFHGEELTVDGVVRLVHHRAHRRHLRVFEYRIPARFFVLEPVANTLAMVFSHR